MLADLLGAIVGALSLLLTIVLLGG